MLRVLIFISISFFVYACANEIPSGMGTADLQLEDYEYFGEEIPFNTFSLSLGVANPDEYAALGRLLFYDTRLSLNNSIACGSCHLQSKAFSDGLQFSPGLENYKTSRNSMALVNVGYHASTFWEGHNGDVENHILDPISNHIEMGMKSPEELVAKLKAIDDYNRLFDEVTGEEITEENLQYALAIFVKSLISYNSKYDKGLELQFANFSIAEQRGRELFFGDAKCGSCHRDVHLTASWRRSANIGLDMEYADQGAGGGKFKIPSLRNISETGPYMHDGRFESLEEVIEHYNTGVQDHPELDWALGGDLGLDENDKQDLIAFLETLTDYEFMADPKFSNPF